MDPFVGEQEDRYWDFVLAVLVIAAPALLLILPEPLFWDKADASLAAAEKAAG